MCDFQPAGFHASRLTGLSRALQYVLVFVFVFPLPSVTCDVRTFYPRFRSFVPFIIVRFRSESCSVTHSLLNAGLIRQRSRSFSNCRNKHEMGSMTCTTTVVDYDNKMKCEILTFMKQQREFEIVR